MRRYTIIFGLILLSVFSLAQLSGCKEKSPSSNIESHPKKVVDLATFSSQLPAGKNIEKVQANCMICHSLEYINMQPKLSKKAWEKTVDKMIHSFGAPVPDSVVRGEIVDYLVSSK